MIFEPSDQDQRLKWVFSSCKNGAWGTEPDGESDVVCIRAVDFDRRLGRLNNGERTLRSIDSATYEKLALRAGDIILEKSGGGEKQLVGRAALFDGGKPSITSNFLARCRPALGMESAFINYLLLAIYNARGTFPHLKQSTGIQNLDLVSFLDVRVSIPPLDTQKQIAQFLDEKTARIDELIEKKRELLDRLSEKRQALITRAVTKGHDPSVPMKPSGIDWLGDIPAHWEVKRLAHISQILLGLTYEPGDLVDEGDGVFVIRASNIQSGKLIKGDDVFVNVGVPERIVNRIGDIVVCSRNGSRNLIGKNAVVTEEWVGCTFGAFMTTIRTELSDWVRWVLASTLFEFQSGQYMSTTINQLTTSTLKNFPIPIPPTQHAVKISKELHFLCSSIDTQYDLVLQSIENLTEYRAALITAATTGQLAGLR